MRTLHALIRRLKLLIIIISVPIEARSLASSDGTASCLATRRLGKLLVPDLTRPVYVVSLGHGGIHRAGLARKDIVVGRSVPKAIFRNRVSLLKSGEPNGLSVSTQMRGTRINTSLNPAFDKT